MEANRSVSMRCEGDFYMCLYVVYVRLLYVCMFCIMLVWLV